jgi:ATP-dependent helicase/nuclease subunit A
VKRQLDGEGHRIRVMTVHGAKGLEAPDRHPARHGRPQARRKRTSFYRLPEGEAVWKVAKEESPP